MESHERMKKNTLSLLLLVAASFQLAGCSTENAQQEQIFEPISTFVVSGVEPAAIAILAGGTAQIGESKPDDSFLLTSHNLKKGSGAVVGYRRYYDAELTVDENLIEYMTIYFAAGIPDSPLVLRFGEGVPTDGTIAYRSDGSFGWFEGSCLGLAKEGTVSVSRLTNGNLAVKIDLVFRRLVMRQPAFPGDSFKLARWQPNEKRCPALHVQTEFQATPKDFEALEEWEGNVTDPLTRFEIPKPPWAR